MSHTHLSILKSIFLLSSASSGQRLLGHKPFLPTERSMAVKPLGYEIFPDRLVYASIDGIGLYVLAMLIVYHSNYSLSLVLLYTSTPNSALFF